jgi:hypothetical protein
MKVNVRESLSSSHKFINNYSNKVHVKEKTIVVHAGEGNQRIQWLAHVGIARYDSNFGLELGVPKGLQSDEGVVFDPNGIINQHISDNQHVWVLIKGN